MSLRARDRPIILRTIIVCMCCIKEKDSRQGFVIFVEFLHSFALLPSGVEVASAPCAFDYSMYPKEDFSAKNHGWTYTDGDRELIGKNTRSDIVGAT